MLKNRRSFLPVFNIADGGQSGGSDPSGGDAAAAEAAAASAGGSGGASARPEWMVESDAAFVGEDGAVNSQGIYEALSDSRKTVTSRDADLREKILADDDFRKEASDKLLADEDFMKGVKDEAAKSGRAADVPDTTEGYAIALPKGTMPEGIEFIPNHEDPMMIWWKDKCLKDGVGQEGFNAGVAKFAQSLSADIPNSSEEIKKLGENGQARVDSVDMFYRTTLGDEDYQQISGLVKTARGVQVLEKLMGQKVNPQIGRDVQTMTQTEQISEADVKTIMADPDYSANTAKGKALQAKVDAWYLRRHKGAQVSV